MPGSKPFDYSKWDAIGDDLTASEDEAAAADQPLLGGAPTSTHAHASHKKLRLLLLHGMSGNGPDMKTAFAQLQRAYPRAELVAPTAPQDYTPDALPHRFTFPLARLLVRWWPKLFARFAALLRVRCWFNATSGDAPKYRMLDLPRLERYVERKGPFDGVLGLSQGAQMAAMLLAKHPHLFDFAVFVAGRKPRDAARRRLYASGPRATLPTLHVYGAADPSKDQSEALAACFDDPEVAPIPFTGHKIPFYEGSTALTRVLAFLDRRA